MSAYHPKDKMFHRIQTTIKYSFLKDSTIQRVTIDDYDKVVGIRDDIYYGADYIPGTFRDLVGHPAYEGYAAVIDGQFVAFMFTLTVDDGLTTVTRASRVRKEYEGKGLYRQFDERVKKILVGKTKLLAMTNHEENGAMLRQIETGAIKLIMKRDFYHFKLSADSPLENIIPQDPRACLSTRRATSEDLKQIFDSPRVSEDLFPEGRIICTWIPFRIMHANIPLLMFHSRTVIGTFNPYCTLISFGTAYKAKIGMTCHVKIYGKDFINIREHLAEHVSQCKEANPSQDLHVWVHLPDGKENVVSDVMKNFGFIQLKELPMSKFYCTEKSL